MTPCAEAIEGGLPAGHGGLIECTERPLWGLESEQVLFDVFEGLFFGFHLLH